MSHPEIIRAPAPTSAQHTCNVHISLSPPCRLAHISPASDRSEVRPHFPGRYGDAVLRSFLIAVVTVVALSMTGCGAKATPEPTPAPAASASASLPAAPKPLQGKLRHGQPWRTSGFVPHPVKDVPYVDELLNEGVISAKLDKDGIPLYQRDGKRYYHPVVIVHYALAKLDVATRKHDTSALEAATKSAHKLLQESVSHRGGLYFPYPYDFPLGSGGTRTIHPPWWSAMAQGQVLSLFVRLYKLTGKATWRRAADKTFATLDDQSTQPGPWSAYVDPSRYLWFEEYAGDTPPLLVLNGDMFAVFGVWDYYELTRSPKARELFDASVTTLREYLPLFRASGGGVSYYCLSQPYCRMERWRNPKYHVIVTEQMRVIAQMTRDAWFDKQADLYAADHSG